jgi:hypothetical protein
VCKGSGAHKNFAPREKKQSLEGSGEERERRGRGTGREGREGPAYLIHTNITELEIE